MLRKWIMPVASLAVVFGLAGTRARAAEDAPAMAGKATVTVKVMDADGKPVAGATVELMPAYVRKGKRAKADPAAADAVKIQDKADPVQPPAEGGKGKGKRPKPHALQTTTTDDAGTAMLKEVADGSYTVTAHMKGMGNGREKVVVADGKDQSVTLTLAMKAKGKKKG